jgi:hypothetical protein
MRLGHTDSPILRVRRPPLVLRSGHMPQILTALALTFILTPAGERADWVDKLKRKRMDPFILAQRERGRGWSKN